MPRDFRVIAIVAAYNEEDIIGQAVSDLVGQGISVYFVDHGSTDGTVAEVEPFLGRGVEKIERFAGDTSRFSWEAILRRKEELASELDADWFLHHDADEFRESPWGDRSLKEAIETVDRFGYDAIDFEVLNFQPTHDGFRKGDDPRESFPCYEPGAAWDKVQVKCWKRTKQRVDLASTGGHEAIFEGRRVFPIRFLLRHYPIRGQAHGERKMAERRTRFVPEERARGWHRQYDDLGPSPDFVRDPATLTRYDADAARLHVALENRTVEELRQTPAARDRLVAQAQRERDSMSRELDARNREAEQLGRELDARNLEAERLGIELDVRNREADRLGWELHARNLEVERVMQEAELLRQALESEVARLGVELNSLRQEALELRDTRDVLRARLEDILQSRSWRWSAPLRGAGRLLTRS